MKLDIIFAGAAKDEQQEKLLLDLLSPLGIDKHTMTEAKSDRKAMESALVTALRRSDVVLLIGGLGSGRSDFTTPLLCEGLGLREEICPAALEQMKKRYKVEEEALSKEDLFKVKIPAGSHPFLNRWGDCPGYALVAEDQCIAALPDGAAELAAMAEEKLLPYLQKIFLDHSQPVEGGAFGISLEQASRKLEPARELAKVVVKKEGLGLLIRILPEGEKNNTETAAGLVKSALEGGFFPGSGSVAAAFSAAAARSEVTVAAAEKEGQNEIRRLLGQVSGAGGEIPRLEVGRKNGKTTGIPGRILKKYKGVSAPLAVHMARSARERFGATIGVGLTGFRAVNRHNDIAYAALCDRDKVWVARVLVPEERLNFDTELAATAALDMARRYADADGVFLAGGEDLLTALSGKIGQERVCTFAPDGTAVWRLPGEAVPVKGKAGKNRREKEPARPLATVGKVALGVLLSAALLAAGAVGSFYWQAYRSGQLRTAMLSLYQSGGGAVPDGYPAEYGRQFTLLWEQNQDIVGWLSVPDTDFSFPVVQGKDNTFYSLRNFKKEPSLYGTTFLNAPASLREDTNVTLYGNHMEDGQMFAQLENYRKLTYYREHPILSFDTVYGSGHYKVCAMFVTDPEEQGCFDYENLQNPEDSAQWEALVEEMEARSLICTPVDIREGDKLLTLSTEAEDFKGARLIVMARQTRSGEVKTVKVDDAVYNAEPVLPEQMQQVQGDIPAPDQEDNRPILDSAAESSASSLLSGGDPSSSGEISSEKEETDSSSQNAASSSSVTSISSQTSSQPSSSVPPVLSSSAASSESEPPEVGVDESTLSESSTSSSQGGQSSSDKPSGGNSSSSSNSGSSGNSGGNGGTSTPSEGEIFRVNGKDYDAYDAVCRVVAAEIGNGNYESIKAQAVATYTLLYKRNQNGNYPTGLSMGTPSSTVRQAVKEVWGEALYAGGRLMDVFYFSISAGRTNEPQEVWGSSVAGYGSVDSPWDENVSSAFQRSVSISKETVIDRVWEYLGIDLSEVPVEDWFTVESYTSGGYNDEMTVGGYDTVQKSGSSAFRTGATITGRILRENVLNLRSACFTWEESGNHIVFTTKGYGHGVGMSQWGAIEMAKQGYSYVEILEYYYPGASVK